MEWNGMEWNGMECANGSGSGSVAEWNARTEAEAGVWRNGMRERECGGMRERKCGDYYICNIYTNRILIRI